jgi:hypothetical protein
MKQRLSKPCWAVCVVMVRHAWLLETANLLSARARPAPHVRPVVHRQQPSAAVHIK